MSLFAKARPTRSTFIPTPDGLHELYVAEYGNLGPNGVPIVYLHGGPGGGIPPDAPRLFDPETFHIVVFDQRGCGNSKCGNRLKANTTDRLVEDAETVRNTLGIDRWIVMGSSYGSLLAVLYAARHPSSVRSVLAHGVFLGRPSEIEWLFEPGGAARFYPQQWADFEAAAAELGASDDDAQRSDGVPQLVAVYHRALIGEHADTGSELLANPLTVATDHSSPVSTRVLAAAEAMARWEDEMETIAPAPATHDAAELIAGAQIAAHYFFHGCFLPHRAGVLPELAARRKALADVPLVIIHGRHDVICPPNAAADLHAAWPNSSLRIVEGGAHALFEKPMRAAAQAALAELSACGGSARTSGGLGAAGGDGAPAASGKRRRGA